MKIYNRRICENETFCCSSKMIKSNLVNIFDNDCFVYFGGLEKEYSSNFYDDRNLSKTIKGIVVARFTVTNNDYFPPAEPQRRERCGLTLFAVQKNLISQTLKDKFASNILPLFIELYKKSLMSCNNPVKCNIIIVELYNDTFITHSIQKFA